jgi:hypothetical protein
VLPPLVARRSLRPQLNQIRSWVREGRTDAWIAHQLEVTVKDIDAFKRDHGLTPEAADGEGEATPEGLDGDVDMRAEDDALVAAELDAMSESEEATESDEEEGEDEEESVEGEARPRRRGRRGGRRRGRRGGRRALEGTFDHGDEGFGLWLDPAIQDDAVYAEHWAGHRPVTVAIEPDRIVIRRSDGGAPSDEAADD